VTPIIDGVPATGFRIASVETDPLIVGVEGEGERLQVLTALETEPVSIMGATRDVETVVDLALPTGITSIDVASVKVVVRIVPITETRSYNAGLRLDGAQAGLRYTVFPDRVVVTLFGSVVDLDRLSSEALSVGLNIASLEPGVHEVTVAPILPAGVTLVSLSPEVVIVTVEETAASVSAGRPSLPTPGPAP
jgi:YbbR domain-containing protein